MGKKLSPSKLLKQAMMNGDDKSVERIVSEAHGVSFSKVNGTKAMHYAASFHDGRWNWLIRKWANQFPHAALERDQDGFSPIRFAIIAENLDAIRIFNDCGAKIVETKKNSVWTGPFKDIVDEQRNLICEAVGAKNSRTIRLLCELYPNDINIPTIRKTRATNGHSRFIIETPLAACVRKNDLETAKTLLEFGAVITRTDPRLGGDENDGYAVFRNSALDIAIRTNNSKFLSLFAKRLEQRPEPRFPADKPKMTEDLSEALAFGDNPNAKTRTSWHSLVPESVNLGDMVMSNAIKLSSYKTIFRLFDKGAHPPRNSIDLWLGGVADNSPVIPPKTIWIFNDDCPHENESKFLDKLAAGGIMPKENDLKIAISTGQTGKAIAMAKAGVAITKDILGAASMTYLNWQKTAAFFESLALKGKCLDDLDKNERQKSRVV